MAFHEGEANSGIPLDAWLARYSQGLQRNLPRVARSISGKDPLHLDPSTLDISELSACHATRSVEKTYGAPEGYQVCYDGHLIIFDVGDGHYMQMRNHVFFYREMPSGEIDVLDFFAAQAFVPDKPPFVKGAAIQQMRELAAAQNASHLITDVGEGLIALRGPAAEILRVFGLDHVTYKGFWAKYGQNGIIDQRKIPNMFTGLSDQQNDQNR